MDLDDEELKATKKMFYSKERIKDIKKVVKRLITNEKRGEKKNENI